jgi:hypothetical protein
MLMAPAASDAEELLEAAERLLDGRFVDAAWPEFMEAERAGADPDRCSAGRWQAAMLRGDFAAAWKESDATRVRGAQGSECLWSGEEINGKRVIVRCLHGFGDAVQMLRYAPLLAARASHVVYETNPKFTALARCFQGVHDVITWNDPEPGWDVQLEVMELPYLFRTVAGDLPIAHKYLSVPEEATQCAGALLGSQVRPRIGLIWTCGDWNPSRNVPLEALQPLSDLDVELWNLQSFSSLDQPSFELRDGRHIADGLVALAAAISQMDLVIAPDTLAAHLAGALGKPAFVMLQYAADWRWMCGRADTPWYPSVRLFRQPVSGDWASVVGEVRRALLASIS